jgi:catechol 2,3-dioxygenase-like lactoylglutathione lyase family enzyme
MPPARLVPELYCSDIARNLEREGAELMLEQPTGRTFLPAPLEYPFGRGMNLQIEVSDVVALYTRATAAGCPLFLELEERWYRKDEIELGNRQFVIQDPDGYLLRFFQDLGER